MLQKLFDPKKEDICPNCGTACFATDVLCPNCGKNLDELFEQLPDEPQPKSFISTLKEWKWPIIWGVITFSSIFFLVHWSITSSTWRRLKSTEAVKYFSGEYFQAFMWSYHFSVMPDQTFSLSIFTDMGFTLDYSGTFIIEENHLLLTTSDLYFDEPTDLVPIRWGERKYIIPSDTISDFCDFISKGYEPRRDVPGVFYLRDGDWEKPITGKPILLDGYSACP